MDMKVIAPLGAEALNCTGRHVVGISGGKDSTALALALKDMHPHIPWEFVITPTGDELPIMHAHWAMLETLLGQPLKRLPGPSLRDVVDKYQTLPNFRMRFCTREIKIEPFMAYMESLPPQSVLYVGLRADEEDRTGIQVTMDDNFRVAFPFQWWDWDLDTVTGYLKHAGVEIPDRTDCARCFFQRLDEWYDLYISHPEIYASACLEEFLIGHTYRSDKRDTWPASLIELAREFDRGRIPKKQKQRKRSTACPWCAK